MEVRQGDPSLAYPIDAAGERLGGLGRTKVYELIKTGQLRTFTIGRYRYVSDEELVRFISERQEQSAREDVAAKVAPAVAARARKRAEAA